MAESPAPEAFPSSGEFTVSRTPWQARVPALSVPGIELAAQPPRVQCTLGVDPYGPAAAGIATALGVALPATPNTHVTAGERDVLWLGPDEWLVLGSGWSAAGAAELEARLRGAAGTHPASIVDTSAQRLVLRADGDRVPLLLSRCCALDLHQRAFQPGTCAQTTLARTPAVLVRRAPSAWLILVRPSSAAYLAAWLHDAATDLSD